MYSYSTNINPFGVKKVQKCPIDGTAEAIIPLKVQFVQIFSESVCNINY